MKENCTGNSFNNVTRVVQGPTCDGDENELKKVRTMEMLMSHGNISTTMMSEPEQMSEENKTLLYARATHSNHVIQYHIQQITERKKVVDEYRNMMMDGMCLTPLESNLHKTDLVVISTIFGKDRLWKQS